MSLDRKFDSIDSKVEGRFEKLETNMDELFCEVAEDVDDLRGRVVRNEKGLENKIHTAIDRQPTAVGGTGAPDLNEKIEKALDRRIKTSRAFFRSVDGGL